MRVLLLDSYDSFTLNLYSTVHKALSSRIAADTKHGPAIDANGPDAAAPVGVDISIVHADQVDAAVVRDLIDQTDLVVIGPGPGSPLLPEDTGILPEVWKYLLELEEAGRGAEVPAVLGVCLGFQTFLNAYGHDISRLAQVRHGVVSDVDITAEGRADLFATAGETLACVRYHSLFATFDEATPGPLVPLAWATDADRRVLMAARHQTLPFWGVQYHPESICSEHGVATVAALYDLAAAHVAARRALLAARAPAVAGVPLVRAQPLLKGPRQADGTPAPPVTGKAETYRRSLPCADAGAATVAICDTLAEGDFALLDSAAAPGRWTVIGVRSASSMQITYWLDDECLLLVRGGATRAQEPVRVPVAGARDVWAFLAHFMKGMATDDDGTEIPFDSGLIGYYSYEFGLAGVLDEIVKERTIPDVDLTFYDRSIIVDHQTSTVYVQSTNERAWVDDTAASLAGLLKIVSVDDGVAEGRADFDVVRPGHEDYVDTVRGAQEFLYSGDSYELCVTGRTTMRARAGAGAGAPLATDAWEAYKRLRRTNPAPYACFLSTAHTAVVGASPERFLTWDDRTRVAELRPIKGTIARTEAVTPAMADVLLGQNPKERAENLMIVDLVRHDLQAFCEPGDVTVPQLMRVEAYATVYQLVSAIEGRYRPEFTGADVLRGALPPGSMTGAPKKRTVEILQALEMNDGVRGIYSGVTGYWDSRGRGDWSVVIRTAVLDKTRDEWTVGAGGAITALSDPDKEWAEMVLKLEGVLQPFL
ncbi:ADC synthase [Dipodascopsis tothii]|uniref:ADC synthase n=1 Tax=Dipodascopsis tothii TaxID=44089 RepID=UPI0034CEBA08